MTCLTCNAGLQVTDLQCRLQVESSHRFWADATPYCEGHFLFAFTAVELFQRVSVYLQRTFKVRPQSEVAESGRTLKNDFALPKVHGGDLHLLSNGYFKIALSHLH